MPISYIKLLKWCNMYTYVQVHVWSCMHAKSCQCICTTAGFWHVTHPGFWGRCCPCSHERCWESQRSGGENLQVCGNHQKHVFFLNKVQAIEFLGYPMSTHMRGFYCWKCNCKCAVSKSAAWNPPSRLFRLICRLFRRAVQLWSFLFKEEIELDFHPMRIENISIGQELRIILNWLRTFAWERGGNFEDSESPDQKTWRLTRQSKIFGETLQELEIIYRFDWFQCFTVAGGMDLCSTDRHASDSWHPQISSEIRIQDGDQFCHVSSQIRHFSSFFIMFHHF